MYKFDSKGNLKPYQPIPTKVTDLKKGLVDGINSKTRKQNYECYIKYSKDLKALLKQELKQWVNGSFVTKKVNPKDIDFVTFIDSSLIKKLGNKLDAFRPEDSWAIYGVDAYIVEVHPPGSLLFKYTQVDTLYWLDLFGHTRVNRKGEKYKKGFLEIIY